MTRMSTPILPFLLALFVAGCGAAPPRPPALRGQVREGTPDAENLALARARAVPKLFAWEPFSTEAFARAQRERLPILLTGAASWCHWCHVMDETTYHDPRIGALLARGFVAIRVDIDERPDIAERYRDWGWPATILLSPDAEEIGKYRGYLAPDELLPILGEAQASLTTSGPDKPAPEPASLPASAASLPWIAARVGVDLDARYDEKEGSWGSLQKSPLGHNILFELRRAAHGDTRALSRALFSLEKQRALIDPVWGGIYQYSTGGVWTHPHYEKLMTYQAQNLAAYAAAFAATRRKDLEADAQRIAGYMNTRLSGPDSGYFVSQDADVGSHDEKAAFIDGDVFHRLGDEARKKLGAPHVDDHVYAYENGLAIAAMCDWFEASGDAAALAKATAAASLVVASHVDAAGLVNHDKLDAKTGSARRFLADAASLGRALVRLYDVTKKEEWLEPARRIAAVMERDLADPVSGAFFAQTVDPAAAGVFARREQPFSQNVLAARFLAALGRAAGDPALVLRARRALAAIATPRAVADQGRMLGELLLALDEVGVFPWTGAAPAL